ncbi:hypothetical protein KVT40_000936 [Elsinoe batatas]|uniref:Cytochrome c oxidase subunit 8, mitochondrial n=1 Tax=Elsinoe batatas TaxID=2601811 RepID=A0A8K0L8A0_9PEZI|nr:hypothetical protein KVT40_000936 [Elsinoe batatas]
MVIAFRDVQLGRLHPTTFFKHDPNRPQIAHKMLSRSAFRAAAPIKTVARRGFSTRAQLASPYHYPEGPRSNIPFNPMTKFFAVRYWGFMAVGFGAPFAIAVWQTKKNK